MPRRRSSLVGAALATGFACILAPATRGQAWPSAPADAGAWLVRPGGADRWVLVRIEGAPPTLRAHAAARLTKRPEMLAGDDDRAVALFPLERGARAVRQVRALRNAVPRSEAPAFSTPEVLAPLTLDATLRGLALWGDGVVALLAPAEVPPRLFHLDHRGWREDPLPNGTARTGSPPGGPLPTDPRLLAQRGELYLLGVDRSFRAGPPASASAPVGGWEPFDAAVPLGWSVASIDAFVTLARFENAGVSVAIAGPGGPDVQGRIEPVPADHALVAVGGSVLAVWEDDDGTLRGSAVTPLGAPIWSGALPTDPPVSKREVANLVMGLGSLLVSVALWVAAPAWLRRPITPPEGYTYAGLGRRTLATMIDLLPGWLAMEALLRWLSWAPPEVLGPAPLVVMLIVTILTAGIGEAAFGRSLGKWVTACRTVNADGRPPEWWRGIARTAAKYLCAPILILHALIPPWKWTHPACVGTAVVRRDPGPPANPPE